MFILTSNDSIDLEELLQKVRLYGVKFFPLHLPHSKPEIHEEAKPTESD
jgi:hypothetical protein